MVDVTVKGKGSVQQAHLTPPFPLPSSSRPGTEDVLQILIIYFIFILFLFDGFRSQRAPHCGDLVYYVNTPNTPHPSCLSVGCRVRQLLLQPLSRRRYLSVRVLPRENKIKFIL